MNVKSSGQWMHPGMLLMLEIRSETNKRPPGGRPSTKCVSLMAPVPLANEILTRRRAGPQRAGGLRRRKLIADYHTWGTALVNRYPVVQQLWCSFRKRRLLLFKVADERVKRGVREDDDKAETLANSCAARYC